MAYKFFGNVNEIKNDFEFTHIPAPIDRYFMPNEGLVDSIDLVDVYYVITPVILQNKRQKDIIARIERLTVQDADIDGAIDLLPKMPDSVTETTHTEDTEENDDEMSFLNDGDNVEETVENSSTGQDELTALGLKVEAVAFFDVERNKEIKSSYKQITIATIDCDFPNLNDYPVGADIESDDWWGQVRNAFLTDYDAKIAEAETQGALAKKMLERVANFLANHSSAASAVGEFSTNPQIERANTARNKAISDFISSVKNITEAPVEFDNFIAGCEVDEDGNIEFSLTFSDFFDHLKTFLASKELNTLAMDVLLFENEIRKLFNNVTNNQDSSEDASDEE